MAKGNKGNKRTAQDSSLSLSAGGLFKKVKNNTEIKPQEPEKQQQQTQQHQTKNLLDDSEEEEEEDEAFEFDYSDIPLAKLEDDDSNNNASEEEEEDEDEEEEEEEKFTNIEKKAVQHEAKMKQIALDSAAEFVQQETDLKKARDAKKAAAAAAASSSQMMGTRNEFDEGGDDDDMGDDGYGAAGLSDDEDDYDDRFAEPTLELPSGEKIQRESIAPVDLNALNQRIQDTLAILSEFAEKREEGKTRGDYLRQYHADLALYYNYSPYLIEKFLELFPPAEALEFLEANEKPRPLTIRTNTLKTNRKQLNQALTARGVNLEAIPWCKAGLIIYDSSVPIGATPEYLSGHYMLQGAASFVPVMALAPQENEKVLDMCSAPGGKSTYLAAMMKNTGQLMCNDVSADRIKSLTANLHRMGVRNCFVSNLDGRKIPQHLSGFDRILLDAPCTGLGVISRDPSIKFQKTEKDFKRLTRVQKELILAAIDALDHKSKTGGVMVYCTCSTSIEENEDVVDYAMKKRHIKVIDTGLPEDFGRPGWTKYREKRYHPSLALSRHFFPHAHNLDGFYVCKIQKLSAEKYDTKSVKEAEVAEAKKAAREQEKAKVARDQKKIEEVEIARSDAIAKGLSLKKYSKPFAKNVARSSEESTSRIQHTYQKKSSNNPEGEKRKGRFNNNKKSSSVKKDRVAKDKKKFQDISV